ncbi:ABC transporter permease [Mesorhizobium tamadayense]|uniref:ABC transporter permease n=1 Tax=Mesorhizobium tamadayense TaxID=425306 RepID=A0A3P3EPG1_9HYPH|nr:ABC transporter permease [Mesorhizobium tamadayense]RRH88284.1 ABC transporter permease [Mesorhizobium tamadayense]
MSLAEAAFIQAVDGVPLKIKLARAERKRKLKAVGLVLPLFLFVVITFLSPLLVMTLKSVENEETFGRLDRTREALASWSGQDLPDEAAFAALAADLKIAGEQRLAGEIAKRINYEFPGAQSKFKTITRKVAAMETGPYRETFLSTDAAWGNPKLWRVIQGASGKYTAYYWLSAVDLRQGASGIEQVPANQAVFLDVYGRTFWIAGLVTGLTLVLGFPVAYLLATQPASRANVLMIFVMLPFWTSLLVRTTAWFVLLRNEGPLNDLAQLLIGSRFDMIFTRFATILAMTHIQLPFTLLPIYSVMKTIPPSHVRAARSLGAGPFLAFWRVYFPQTVPGIAAGCLLTFILSLGYYITPALVGGPRDQMVSNYVSYYMNNIINFGQASALGATLLIITLVLYWAYNRLVGIDKMKLG